MSTRKRDDLTGFLYRVVEREAGSTDEWVHSDCGNYGRPRTYMTVGAARGQASAARQKHWKSDLEFAVERAPVTDWEIVSDE